PSPRDELARDDGGARLWHARHRLRERRLGLARPRRAHRLRGEGCVRHRRGARTHAPPRSRRVPSPRGAALRRAQDRAPLPSAVRAALRGEQTRHGAQPRGSRRMSLPLALEVVATAPELLGRESELWDLFERDPHATPFQAPAWILPWVTCFAASSELRVLCLRHRGRLVFVLPLYVDTEGEERVARLIGAGISDYLGALSDPEHDAAVAARAREFLSSVLEEVDRIELSDLKAGSVLERVVAAMPDAHSAPCAPCPKLTLGRSLEEHVARLPFHLRRNLRQSAARLARRGRVEWRS